MRFLKNFAVVILVVILVGCAGVDPNLKIQASDGANPWTHLNLYNKADNFQFAIVSDRTGAHRPGVFASAVEKLNLLKPEFVISIGDLIEGRKNTSNEAELNSMWDEFDGLVNKLEMPFFYVPGNHDITNPVMAKKWEQRLGSSYYHFTYHNVLFICVNTEDPHRHCIGDRQIEYFREVLNANENVRWTLVFMHEPLWKPDEKWGTDKGKENWRKFESLLADRPYTIFAGHLHIYSKSVRNGRQYYVLATTGGGFGKDEYGNPLKKSPGLAKCRFDHIVWVTMTDDGPVLANLLLEGILDDEPCPQ